jgi:hypothetical protein
MNNFAIYQRIKIQIIQTFIKWGNEISNIRSISKIHFGSKIWQAPLYDSFVNLAYLKNFNYWKIIVNMQQELLTTHSNEIITKTRRIPEKTRAVILRNRFLTCHILDPKCIWNVSFKNKILYLICQKTFT